MKRALTTAIICTFIISFTTAGHALEISKTEEIDHHKMLHKAKRGAINVLTSPAEIPKQIKAEYNGDGEKTGSKVASLFGGTVKGLIFMGGRIGTGLWDIVTFNLAVPKEYEPVMKPEFVFDKDE